jgi:2-ketocyclohexanecarboxyl-CoA hydrolase
MSEFQDIIYEERDGYATITINRPEKYNAFRTRTILEMIKAFQIAGWNKNVSAIVLTGTGDKAFCTGGDKWGDKDDTFEPGEMRGAVAVPAEDLYTVMRDVPKPVIARVQGLAIGGGNVLATICDMTIAGESAQFGQVGPKMGSVDPGFGTAYLARVVGEKKAREMWFMCKRYSAQEAMDMGLANTVVPDDKLDEEVAAWCEQLTQRSPTAIALAKKSMNADSESIRGIMGLSFHALHMYYNTDESAEGMKARAEKRKPDFKAHFEYGQHQA